MKNIIIILTLLLSNIALAQDRLIDTLVARFQRSMDTAPTEKIYLQTSKDIYETGEDLWFKGYVLDAESLQLSAGSRTLYVQMFAADSGDLSQPIWQEKYLVTAGTTQGHIFVPTDLRQGDYFLEAYTSNSFSADSTPITSLRKVRIVSDITKVTRTDSPKIDSLGEPSQLSTPSLRLISRNSRFLEFLAVNNSTAATQKVYLLGQTRGAVCCVAKAELTDSIKIRIPLSEFVSQGVAEFTLYDPDLKELGRCEVYVNPQQRLYITATLDRRSYEIRGKATMLIKVTDRTGAPVVGANLGVSVFDHNYTNRTDTINIVNYGYGGKTYDSYGSRPITDQITGQFTVRSKKFKNTEQFIQLSDAGDHTQFMFVDTTGRFSIDVDLLTTLWPGYIYLKPMVTQEFGPNIDFDDQFEQINKIRTLKSRSYPFVSNAEPAKDDDLFFMPYRMSQDSAIIVDNVTIKAKLQRPTRDKFMGKLNTLAQKNLGPWVCEHGHLENYLDGYTVHHDPRYCPFASPPKEKNPPVVGKSYRIIKPKYFDNQRFIVEDERTIIYQAPYYTDQELLKMNNLWRTKSFYEVRDFYQPTAEEMQSAAPDFRNTLLWSPNVVTDNNGQARLEFYCSDINTLFTARIEGVGGAGLLGSSTLDFRVMRLPPKVDTK